MGAEIPTMLHALIDPKRTVRQIGDQLYSALPEGDEGAPYDAYAAAYDRAVSTPAYLRIAWGISRADNAGFVRAAFESNESGWLVDFAAGSCVDSAAAYAETERPTIVLDRSVAMLEKGIERLTEVAGRIPPNIVFLQADAKALPLRSSSVKTVLCHGAYHVFDETRAITSEWRRTLEEDGTTFVSSIVRGRWIGDRYLSLLARSGEIAPPRSVAEFVTALEENLGETVDVASVGNFAYARTRSSSLR